MTYLQSIESRNRLHSWLKDHESKPHKRFFDVAHKEYELWLRQVDHLNLMLSPFDKLN